MRVLIVGYGEESDEGNLDTAEAHLAKGRKNFIICSILDAMIEDLKETRHMIFAKHIYNVSYNKDTKEFGCDCIGFRIHKKCKHVEEFREYLENLKRKKEEFDDLVL